MCFIPEIFPGLPDDAVNMVNRQVLLQHIMFGDEDNIGLIQRVIRIAFLSQVRIQQTTVVPCPFDTSAAVAALDFNVISTVRFIHGKNIQPYRTALQIVQVVLAVNFLYRQIITVKNDFEQEFGTFFVLKDLAHEIIIHKPQVTNAAAYPLHASAQSPTPAASYSLPSAHLHFILTLE